jgi:hypothetical protein
MNATVIFLKVMAVWRGIKAPQPTKSDKAHAATRTTEITAEEDVAGISQCSTTNPRKEDCSFKACPTPCKCKSIAIHSSRYNLCQNSVESSNVKTNS